MLTITPLPAFSDNYIWLFHQTGSHDAFVVDPGDAQAVESMLQDKNLTLTGILLTHHHYDHTGGVAELTKNRNIPVYGPANTLIHGITHLLNDSDTITIAGSQFRVIITPGHTLDHITYFTENGENGIPTLFS
ncbi:MAG: MBL fold metallo-hydrolase, partial [Endozoicomonas sp.]